MTDRDVAPASQVPPIAPFLTNSLFFDPRSDRYARAYTRRLRGNMSALSRTVAPASGSSGLHMVRAPEQLTHFFRYEAAMEATLMGLASISIAGIVLVEALLDPATLIGRLTTCLPTILLVAALLYVRIWGAPSLRGPTDLAIGIQDGWIDICEKGSVVRIHRAQASHLQLVSASARDERFGPTPEGAFVMSREGWTVVDANLWPAGVDPVRAVVEHLRLAEGRQTRT